MASALATTPLRRAGAAAPSRGAAQVARVVPNKKALSYDSGWKKVRGGDWGGHVRVRARTEGAVGGRRAGVERAERARALRGARPPPPLLSSRPLSNLSLSHPSLSPPFILQNKDYGFFTSGYFLEGKETRGTNYLAVSVTG